MAEEEKNNSTEEVENQEEESQEDSSTSEEETQEESQEEEETPELVEGLSPDDLKIAATLYKGLNSGDKTTQTKIITNLAGQLGIGLSGEGSSKKAEDKETGEQKSVKKLVEDNLPPSYKVMAPVLTTLLEKFQADFVKPEITSLAEGRQVEYEANAIQHLIDSKGEETVNAAAPKMQQLAKRFKPSGLQTQKDYNEYINDIYTLATKDTSSKDVNQKVANSLKKTKQNSERAKPGPSDVTRVKRGSKPISVDDAVRMAMEGKEFEN